MDTDNQKWDTIEPGVWKPEEEGDEITGILVNKMPKEDNISARYVVENKGGLFTVWGSAVLDYRMQYVKIGQVVKITFLGKGKNAKGQDLNKYKVQVAKPKEKKPVLEWLKGQGRFRHLFKEENAPIIEEIQKQVDKDWEELLKLESL